MGLSGFLEIVRRLGALALAVTAVVFWFGEGPWWPAAALAVGALLLYFALPRPRFPRGAYRYEGMPAIYMPDLLGFLVGIPLFALPFLVMQGDPLLEGNWLIVLFMWVPAALSPAVFVIAARHASSWVELMPAAGKESGPPARARVVRFGKAVEFALAEVGRVEGQARRLPGWVSWLLILFGGIRGTGVALLHGSRRSHRLLIEYGDGDRIVIPADAFPGMEDLLAALLAAGVELPAGLSAGAEKRIRRQARSGKGGAAHA